VGQGALRWEAAQHWPKAMTNDLDAYWLRRGDVILAMDRPWIEAGLKYAWVRDDDLPSLLVQRVARLRGTPALNTGFLRYVIGSRAFTNHVLAVQTGTSVPHISPGQIKEYSFALPALVEQERIASVLGALDDKIDLNRRMCETLEAIGRALFRSWFVEFTLPSSTGGSHRLIDSGVSDVFPAEVDSTSKTPRGWTRRPLGEWVEALSGGTPSKSDSSLWGGDVAWISPKVMTEIHADTAEEYVTLAAIGNGTRLAPSGSTLVMVRGMGLHKSVRVSQARSPVAFSQDVKALAPKGIEPSLLLFALLNGQQELLGKVESSGHGTGKLPSEILFSHSIVMPPPENQAELTRTFDLLGDRIASARSESRALAALRDVLLPGLLAGELRCRDVAPQIEAST
jgi:type I restriction enzyme S subunit